MMDRPTPSSADVTDPALWGETVSLREFVDDTPELTPTVVAIEPVMGCNSACVMCPVHTLKRDRGVMSMDLFERIADKVAEIKPSPLVVLNFLGEPLLDKQLEKRIRALKERGVETIGFNSNFSLMTPSRARSILETGLSYVEVSFESLRKEVYEKIRVGLVFETVLENILSFFKIRDELGLGTVIRPMFIEQEATRDEMDHYIAYFSRLIDRSKGDEIRIYQRHNFGGHCSSEFERRRPSCGLIWNSLIILNDGEVSLCCGDSDNLHKMGNVLDESIMSVFNNKKFRFARKLHREGKRDQMSLCSICNIPDVDSRSA